MSFASCQSRRSAGAATAAHHWVPSSWPPAQPPPAGYRVPFGWQALPVVVPLGPPLALRWQNPPTGRLPTAFRVSLAIDMRGTRRIAVRVGGGGEVIGELDVRSGSTFQPLELPLAPELAPAVVARGLELSLAEGADPLWIFRDGNGISAVHQPHLLLPGGDDPILEFRRRFCSMASIQQFGWMEGCVLDGLADLAAGPTGEDAALTLQAHLDRFLVGPALVYEEPQSRPTDDHIYGIEGTLPFAAIARERPRHPSIDLALAFWAKHRDAEGVVIDGDNTTSEGAYTVGYPMAVIGRMRNDADLMRAALTQVTVRQKRFFDGSEFWRTVSAKGRRTNRNWARGVAWQLLGGMRTLEELRPVLPVEAAAEELAGCAAWARRHQRADGLWSVFIDEPNLTQDTAGSAGIAAALAIGAQQGWLPPDAREAAKAALAGLSRHLTPDGLLGGASPSNKGGEGLQRSDYRIIYPMAMGLLAQLQARL